MISVSSTVLFWLMQLNITLTLLLLSVLVLRKPFQKVFGGHITYYIWLVPLFYLIFSQIVIPHQFSSQAQQFHLLLMQPLKSAETFTTPTVYNLSADTTKWIVFVWLTVAFALLIKMVASLVRFDNNLDLKFATQIGPHRVFYSDSISSPLVVGFFIPKIVLPSNFFDVYSHQQATLLLQHEQIHCQRKDNLINLMVTVIRLIFWFNPIVHLSYKFFRIDQEISVDTQVIGEASIPSKIQYTEAILRALQAPLPNLSPPNTLSRWFNQSSIQERANMLRNHKKGQVRSQIGLLTLLLTYAVTGFSAVDTKSIQLEVVYDSIFFGGKERLNAQWISDFKGENALNDFENTGKFREVISVNPSSPQNYDNWVWFSEAEDGYPAFRSYLNSRPIVDNEGNILIEYEFKNYQNYELKRHYKEIYNLNEPINIEFYDGKNELVSFALKYNLVR